MPYQIPPGLENIPWEQYRQEMGIETISRETRPGIVAGFQQWQAQRQIQQRYQDITDFGSEYYQQYRGLLGKITPTVGTGTVLAGLQAGGGNYAASQVQAGARVDELSRERTDFLNTATSQFALGSQAQAGGLLGQYSQNAQFLAQLEEQRRQFDESQPDFWDSLLNIGATALGTGAGFLIGGPPGAMVGGSIASQATKPGGQGGYGGFAPNIRPSDRRLKENVEIVGVSPGGFDIIEFNYIGSLIRLRGGSAQNVERIMPEAVMIINGIKYLDYSKLDISFEVI